MAWFSHKYIMHGFLWNLHKDHHVKNKKSWNDFRIATKEFNTEKNNFYKNQKKELKKIIDIKKSLINEIDTIIKSNKISENSNRVKLIQEEWKKAGYLPRKISNSLWNDFKPLINMRSIKRLIYLE